MQRAARLRAALAAGMLAAGGMAQPATAQNLLANPNFPKVLGVGSWTVRRGLASWDTFECGFTSPDSGSAYVESTFGFVGATLDQCVPAQPGTRYQLIGSVYRQSGMEAELRMLFAEGTCGARVLIDSASTATSVPSDWVDLEVSATAPPGTTVVIVELNANDVVAGAIARGYFDDIYLPEPGTSGAVAALGMLTALARRRRRAHGSRTFFCVACADDSGDYTPP